MKQNIKEKVMKFEEHENNIIPINGKHNLNDLVLKYVTEDPVLDVGCGDGALMYVLKDKFEVEGFDASKFIIGIAKERGLSVSVSTINEFRPTKKYKTIMMIGVFNHLYNLERDFKKVVSWLDKDGILLLCVPNSLSPFLKRHISYLRHPSYVDVLYFLEDYPLELIKYVGAGRLPFFPSISSAVLFVLKKK